MKNAILIICSLLLLLASNASAATIDFRQHQWRAAHGHTTFDYSFVGGELDGLGLNIEAGPAGARIWQDSSDGLGVIHRWENDEIEWDETLKLSFTDDVTVNTISLADLFREGHVETGRYSTDYGASWNEFRAITSGNNGQLTLNIGDIVTDSVWFAGTMREGHEFALQRIGISYLAPTPPVTPPAEIPEPASMILLMSGLLGAAGFRKKAEA